MRVIAGEKRHLLLKTLEGLSIRPTTDKIKETLFNMIHFDIPGKDFLDLFAGSGAIGIEALSRGAKSATFVDNNEQAIRIIKENLEHTKLTDRAQVIRNDVALSLENLSRKNVRYGIVFMDPPYDKGLYKTVFEKLLNSNLIDKDTIIILETSIDDTLDGITELGYKMIKEKKYKSNKHLFFKKV